MPLSTDLITENPFAILVRRINRIESQNEQILSYLQNAKVSSDPDDEPYGDFQWLCRTCSGVPASTLRIKSASGEIPGVTKFGKRVMYDKTSVLNWLRSQTRRSATNASTVEKEADAQINRQFVKRASKGL